MSGHRQAAAALYALDGQDRELILARLPSADQERLRAHLHELAALGFDSEAMGADIRGPAPAHPVATDLACAPAAAVFELLRHEPAALVAQVLALQDWRWSSDFLAMHSSSQRQLIGAAHAGDNAPARARFLLDTLSARMVTDKPAPPVVSHAAFTGLRRWMTAWRR